LGSEWAYGVTSGSCLYTDNGVVHIDKVHEAIESIGGLARSRL